MQHYSKYPTFTFNVVILLVQVTRAFALDDCPERCPVRLFELYNSRCPANRPADALYLRPRLKVGNITNIRMLCIVTFVA